MRGNFLGYWYLIKWWKNQRKQLPGFYLTEMQSSLRFIIHIPDNLPSCCIPEFNKLHWFSSHYLSRVWDCRNKFSHISIIVILSIHSDSLISHQVHIPHSHNSTLTSHQDSVAITWWTNTLYLWSVWSFCLKDHMWASYGGLLYLDCVISWDKQMTGEGCIYNNWRNMSNTNTEMCHLLHV